MLGESLLVNFVYCHPVGHAVEALQYCLGYRRADPDRRIGVVLKSNTAVDLAYWCDFIDEVYTADFDVFGTPDPGVLDHVPTDWDWVMDDSRGHDQWQRDFFPGIAAYYDLAARHFRTTQGHTSVGAPNPVYQSYNRLELTLPSEAQQWAAEILPRAEIPDHAEDPDQAENRDQAGETHSEEALNRDSASPESLAQNEIPTNIPNPALRGSPDSAPLIAVLPAGSAEGWRYPTVNSWSRILGGLLDRWPHARFCFVGKLADDGRTSTGFTRAQFDALAEIVPRASWAVDVTMAQQIAAIQRCDLLISPHTGFSFTALTVGTPWLSIAGNDWAEYYFNPGVPFYSVLPDPDRFPCYVMLGNTPEPVEDEGPRSPSMCAERIDADLPELLGGAAWLLSGRADFEMAMRDHFARVHALFRGRTDLMFSQDNLHVTYLPPAAVNEDS